MEVSGQLHAPQLYHQGKNTRYPLDRKLSGPQSWSGHDVIEKNSQSPPGIETPSFYCSARRLVSIPTELSRKKPLTIIKETTRNRDSSVVQRWAKGWMIGGSRPGRGWEFFSSPPHPDRLWGSPSLLPNGYQWFILWG
jgi:hypothetical protein